MEPGARGPGGRLCRTAHYSALREEFLFVSPFLHEWSVPLSFLSHYHALSFQGGPPESVAILSACVGPSFHTTCMGLSFLVTPLASSSRLLSLEPASQCFHLMGSSLV